MWARTRLGFVVILILLVPLLSECAFWLGSETADALPRQGSCGVLVLGYPARDDGSAHPVQVLRVKVGVEAFRERGCQRLVLSGGAVANEYVEADVMSRLASGLGVPREEIVAEREARSTWENVALSIPLLTGYDTIYVASDSLHAYRGRRYLCKQRPDLCPRAVAIGGYHPFELLWWKVPASLWELRAWLRDMVAEREEAPVGGGQG